MLSIWSPKGLPINQNASQRLLDCCTIKSILYIILHLESSWGPWVASTCPCDGSLRVKTRTCHPGGSHQHNCTGLHELIVPCQSSHCKSFIQFLFFGIHVILIILIFLNHSPNPVINFFP